MLRLTFFPNTKLFIIVKNNQVYFAARMEAAMISRVKNRAMESFFEKVNILFKGKKIMPDPSPLKNPNT